METFSERAMAGALAVLLDPKTAEEDRTDAAWVVRGLHRRVPLTEALIADVGRALRCNLGAPGALARLLVVLHDPGVDASRTKNAVARAAELALQRGCLPGLHTLVLAAFDDPAWSEIARDEYGAAAFAWAISDLPARRTEALMLLGGWIRLRDAVPEWVGLEIRRRPTLVALLRPPVAMAWRLHAAAPTAEGWHFVLSVDGKGEFFAPDAFGASLDDAVKTLGEAIAEEPHATARVVLASWLSRLGG
ncbi:MAG: hypothetical protein ACLP1X_21390 [Polyangiaceae bacterium]